MSNTPEEVDLTKYYLGGKQSQILADELNKIYGGALAGGATYYTTNTYAVVDESSLLTEEQVKAAIQRLEECMVIKDNPLAKYEAENVLLEIKVKEYKPKYDGIWRMDIT